MLFAAIYALCPIAVTLYSEEKFELDSISTLGVMFLAYSFLFNTMLTAWFVGLIEVGI